MTNSTSPSRRTVVKGAAWAAPAVVVASAVPAIASSVEDDEVCTASADELAWYGQAADVIAWTKAIGADASTISGQQGTFFDARLGTWQFALGSNPKFRNQNITGYKINWKPGAPITLRPIDIDQWNNGGKLVEGPADPEGNRVFTGRFSVAPNSDPLYPGSGLVFTASIQTNMPYWLACSPNQFERRFLVSVPFTVTFVRGLNPEGVAQPELECGAVYYWNAVMYAGLGCATYSNTESSNWVSVGLPEIAPKA